MVLLNLLRYRFMSSRLKTPRYHVEHVIWDTVGPISIIGYVRSVKLDFLRMVRFSLSLENCLKTHTHTLEQTIQQVRQNAIHAILDDSLQCLECPSVKNVKMVELDPHQDFPRANCALGVTIPKTTVKHVHDVLSLLTTSLQRNVSRIVCLREHYVQSC